MKNIAKKLNAIRNTIRHPERSQHNGFDNYDYSSRDDIYAVVRRELNNHQVEWIPSMTLVSREESDTETTDGLPELRHHVRLEILYVDCDSGESLTQTWHGESLYHDEKGIQMAGTQAIRFALTAQFMLLDAAENDRDDHGGNNADPHEIHLATNHENAPPIAPARAIVERLHDVGLSDDQVGMFCQWMADVEEVEDITELGRARMLAWYRRFESLNDAQLLIKAKDALGTLEAAA